MEGLLEEGLLFWRSLKEAHPLAVAVAGTAVFAAAVLGLCIRRAQAKTKLRSQAEGKKRTGRSPRSGGGASVAEGEDERRELAAASDAEDEECSVAKSAERRRTKKSAAKTAAQQSSLRMEGGRGGRGDQHIVEGGAEKSAEGGEGWQVVRGKRRGKAKTMK